MVAFLLPRFRNVPETTGGTPVTPKRDVLDLEDASMVEKELGRQRRLGKELLVWPERE